MKIYLRKTVNGYTSTVTLADDTTEGHDDLVIQGQNSVQVVSGCRWTDVEVFDRGNEINTITFSINKAFSSAALCEQGMLYHKVVLRGRWDAFFMLYGTSNLRWMKNVVVRTITMAHRGCYTPVGYEIIGGRIRQAQNDTAS